MIQQRFKFITNLSNSVVRSIILLTLSTFAMPFFAQTSNVHCDSEKEYIFHAREEVAQFTQYLSDITNKRLTIVDRYKYKDIALNLFMGQGKDYAEIILDKNGIALDTIVRKAVTIEVPSLTRKTKTRKSMAKYLQRLADFSYKPISIQTIKYHIFHINEIRESASGINEVIVDSEKIYICNLKDNKMTLESANSEKKVIIGGIDVVNTDEGNEVIFLGDVIAIEIL